MNILQWNVRGFLSHCGEFKQFMLKEAPLIAAVQETHLRDQDPYNFNVHGYSFYTDNINSEHRQGGVGLYVSNGLLQTPLKLHTPLNAVGVKVRLCAREITVMSIYVGAEIGHCLRGPQGGAGAASGLVAARVSRCCGVGGNPLFISSRVRGSGKAHGGRVDRR